MSKQNITLDITEKKDDVVEEVAEEVTEDVAELSETQQKKIEGWLNEEENNLIELERLKKQQELVFKKMNDNIAKAKILNNMKNMMSSIKKVEQKCNIKKNNELKKQLKTNNSRISHFKLRLF